MQQKLPLTHSLDHVGVEVRPCAVIEQLQMSGVINDQVFSLGHQRNGWCAIRIRLALPSSGWGWAVGLAGTTCPPDSGFGLEIGLQLHLHAKNDAIRTICIRPDPQDDLPHSLARVISHMLI